MPTWISYGPSILDTICADQLKTNPIFNPFATWPGVLNAAPLYLEPNNPAGVGSLFAQQQKAILLAEMIPALSYATGSHTVGAIGLYGGGNFNMNNMENGWPAVRGAKKDWWHGDYKTIAYHSCPKQRFES